MKLRTECWTMNSAGTHGATVYHGEKKLGSFWKTEYGDYEFEDAETGASWAGPESVEEMLEALEEEYL